MISFWFKEAFRIFGRAKSSFILSLITLIISILLIAASLYTVYLSNRIEDKIKEQFIVNIFLDDTLSVSDTEKLTNELRNKNYCASISFIDKEKAAELFVSQTGEDFRKILDYNPIPASISLKLKSEFVDKDSIDSIQKQISSFAGVDEIQFEHVILDKIVSSLKSAQMYIFILTGLLILISIYITYSTIKLVISLKDNELETMKLVGAKLSSIKMPIIINELITGFLGGIAAFGIIEFLFTFLTRYNLFLKEFYPKTEFIAVVILIGPVISILVSAFVLRKITLKI